jgi:hypothetical protein
MYKHFSNFLGEAMAKGDETLVAYLLDGMQAHMTDDHLDEARHIQRKYLDVPGLESLMSIMIEKIGVDAPTAASYFNKHLMDKDLPRTQLQDFLPHLGVEFGAVYASALFRGDVAIARCIREHYSHNFPLTVPMDAQLSIDGQEVACKSESMSNLTSLADLRYIFENTVSSGLGMLAGKGEGRRYDWMLSDSKLKPAIEMAQQYKNPCELPVVERGVIHNPELLHAFNNAQQHTHYPEMYGRMLAWVATAELPDYASDLIPLESVKTFGIGFEKPDIVMPLESFCVDVFNGRVYVDRHANRREGIWTFTGINIGLAPITDLETLAQQAKTLCRYLLPSDQALGLNHKAGFTLCMVRTHWLDQFEAGHVNAERIEAAQAFAVNYYPVDLYLMLAKEVYNDKVNNGEFIGLKNVPRYSAAPVFEYLNDPVVAKPLKEIINAELWQLLFENTGAGLGFEGLLAAREHFGFTLGMLTSKVTLSYDLIRDLHRAGYEMQTNPGESPRVRVDIQNATDHSQAAYKAIIDMGGWPNQQPEFANAAEAIKAAVRKHDQAIHIAYLQSIGVKKAIEGAKTEVHWNFLRRIFDNSQITPHLDDVPEKYRADILSIDLGL